MNKFADVGGALADEFPNWNLSIQQSGVAVWVDLNNDGFSFSIQITPSEGVGVSLITQGETIDMSRHDDVFDDVEQAITYIKSVAKTK